MAAPHRHLLPDGTPVYSGYESPYDENGVDLTLIDAMLALTVVGRFAWLEDVVALGARPGADFGLEFPGELEGP
jgi:hypothetical protein